MPEVTAPAALRPGPFARWRAAWRRWWHRDEDRAAAPTPAPSTPDPAWTDRLQRTLAHAGSHGGYRFCALVLRLHGLRAALAELPAGARDELVDEARRRLETCLRPADLAAAPRVDDDQIEWLVLLEDRAGAPWVPELSAWMAEMAEPYTVAHHPVRLRLCLAALDQPPAGAEAAAAVAMLRAAALRAEAEGHAGPLLLDDELQRRDARERAALQTVQTAIERGEFALALTPVRQLADGQALLQHATLIWTPPHGGRVGEDAFFPEGAGLPATLAWTRQALLLAEAASAELPTSLAVPAALFDHPALLTALADTARRLGTRAARLELRLPESALRCSATAPGFVQALQALGFRLAVHGLVGAPSLSGLARWPVHGLVIDAAIVAALPDGETQRVLVQGLVGLAQMLQLQAVAVGVDTDAQRLCLLELGVQAGGGAAAAAAARRDEALPA